MCECLLLRVAAQKLQKAEVKTWLANVVWYEDDVHISSEWLANQ